MFGNRKQLSNAGTIQTAPANATTSCTVPSQVRLRLLHVAYRYSLSSRKYITAINNTITFIYIKYLNILILI